MILLFWFVLALVAAYRETEILVQRGSWSPLSVRIPFWDNLFGIKNTDSFHFMWGLWWALITLFMVTEAIWYFVYGEPFIKIHLFIIGKEIGWLILSIAINSFIYWQSYMYFRNIGMHILFRTKDFRRWKYLSPVQF